MKKILNKNLKGDKMRDQYKCITNKETGEMEFKIMDIDEWGVLERLEYFEDLKKEIIQGIDEQFKKRREAKNEKIN